MRKILSFRSKPFLYPINGREYVVRILLIKKSIQEGEARIQQLEHESRVQEQLLNQVIEDNRDLFGFAIVDPPPPSRITRSPDMHSKARRKTATPTELLYPLKESRSLEALNEVCLMLFFNGEKRT